MADPKRLVILKKITDHLVSDLTFANGYQHELTAESVVRGRSVVSDNSPLPMVSVLEGLNPDTDSQPSDAVRTRQVSKWFLLIQGWTVDDEENPTDPAYRLAADVQKSLSKLVPGLMDRLVAKMSFEPAVCRPPDQLSSRAYFYLRLRLEVVDDFADPYRLT